MRQMRERVCVPRHTHMADIDDVMADIDDVYG